MPGQERRYELAVPEKEAMERLAAVRQAGVELRSRAEKVGDVLADPYSIESIASPETLERWLKDKQVWIDRAANTLESVFDDASLAFQFKLKRDLAKRPVGSDKTSLLSRERRLLKDALQELTQIENELTRLTAAEVKEADPEKPPPRQSQRPGLFISHASKDKRLVDPFVDIILRLGCEVPPERLFYSSGADTGVPAGENLNTYVRDQVSEAGLVVAIVTPTFRDRPFCIAELGAAWSRVGNLFPLALPGMPRVDLDGVLSGLLVKPLDDGSALDELRDRVAKVVGARTNTVTWGARRSQWLAEVDSYVSAVPRGT